MIKKIIYFFQAFLIYFFFLLAKLIGLNFSRILFSFIFKKLGPLIKSKKIINKNLENFSKSLTQNEKNEIISKMWSNYGMTFAEYIFLKKFRQTNKHIFISGEKLLNEISKNNKPMIFISGHFANFELMSMEITKKDIPLATIYRPLNNFFLNPFMEYLRKQYICKNQIEKGQKGVKKVVEYINEKKSIALMIDQRVSEGEKINFFGKKALTTTLPAQLAFKYNLEIVPVFIKRNKNNTFNIELFDPISSKDFKNKTDLTVKLNQIIEAMIIKNPDQWIWTHNRWK